MNEQAKNSFQQADKELNKVWQQVKQMPVLKRYFMAKRFNAIATR